MPESQVLSPLIKIDFKLRSCGLCNKRVPLRESHIIPKFVFDWLKETSATGHIRFGEIPNLRVQDGWKPTLLCDGCEQRFSKWETIFADRIFVPLHHGETGPFRYESWMAKFIVSVSWRVLTVFKFIGGLADFPQQIIDASDRALQCWKEFLLDMRPHPGHFEQHLLPVDMIANSTIPGTPPNINRYLMRAIEIYVAQNKISAIVYSKMGRIILFGFIEMPARIKWKGTKLHVTSGTFGGIGKYGIPKYIGEFIIDRAKRMGAIGGKLSDRQWKIIEEAYRNNPDRAAQSEMLRAMQQDVALFGEAAFFPENEKTSK